MNPFVCTNVWRDEGEPLYDVKIYDLDNPVNYHSYGCIVHEQGRNLREVHEKAEKKLQKFIMRNG